MSASNPKQSLNEPAGESDVSPWISAICALVSATMAVGPASAGPSECGLPDISGSSELHQFLSLRAVDVVKRAAGSDEGLAALVAPTASFGLGAGDLAGPWERESMALACLRKR